jgi:endogenous inhibitor of DNA gyrase (YacG/DUF329 family)
MAKLRGKVYRCPICGAEVTVLAHECGEFHPVCCNVPMTLEERTLVFYVCPHCRSEVTLTEGFNESAFAPMCCNAAMIKQAA